MASAYKNTYTGAYRQGAVYGSLAYDLNNPELYPEVEYSAPLERTLPGVGERTAPRTAVRTRRRAKQGVSPAALMGMLAAAVLFVISIMAQIQLMDISSGSVELQNQLSELETQQAKLKIAYESAFNLTEIEEYAVSELGMQKPTADQICYIDTSSPDRAVVVAQANNESFVDRVADFISGIGSYFR